MHSKYVQAASLTHNIIGAAIEVHKIMGLGLLESIYEWCLIKELELRDHLVKDQRLVRSHYKQFQRDESLRFDILVDECVLVDVKAAETIHPINKAQLLSYMKLLDVPLGLLINFNVLKLVNGVARMILRGANSEELEHNVSEQEGMDEIEG